MPKTGWSDLYASNARIRDLEEKLRDMVEAAEAIERGVIRAGCDIDRGSRWAMNHRFSDLYNALRAAVEKAKNQPELQ